MAAASVEAQPKRAGQGALAASVTRRPADDRPRHDDAALADLGIRRYASQRLVLYTDIDPEIARTLPPLIDAAYPAWVDYFGALPESADGSEFQLTGYVMQDRSLFRDAGLLPDDLIEFEHGRHRGYRFWMAEQRYDYYRRHLLIHEATHCFMLILPRTTRPPLFYLEGMAELFGGHQLRTDGQVEFRVMPRDPNEAVGFGRIEMIQQAVRQGRGKLLAEVLGLSAQDFTESKSDPYAWSWAVCKFLDAHPRYGPSFRELAAVGDGTEFRRRLGEWLAIDGDRMQAEWDLFAHTLVYGYDIPRAAIDFRGGEPLPAGRSMKTPVASAAGWQSSGVRVEPGQSHRLTSTGTVTLAREPKPWLSGPQGITIEYAGGSPLGRVLAAVQSDTPVPEGEVGRLSCPIDVGREATFTSPVAGTLYLRVNDHWNRLGDNEGAYEIEIRRVAP